MTWKAVAGLYVSLQNGREIWSTHQSYSIHLTMGLAQFEAVYLSLPSDETMCDFGIAWKC